MFYVNLENDCMPFILIYSISTHTLDILNHFKLVNAIMQSSLDYFIRLVWTVYNNTQCRVRFIPETDVADTALRTTFIWRPSNVEYYIFEFHVLVVVNFLF